MTDIKKHEPLWGAWYVDSLIGEGSFGKVYKVRREEFGKTYYSAVKVMTIPQNDADLRQVKGEGMNEASLRSYFHAFVMDIVQEIDLMSEFRGNSNIVSFEDHRVIEKTGRIGWDILIRMELLKSLTEHVTEKPLPQDEVIKLGIHICRALELCAVKNTIHRDIKPDNIFVSQFGDYKLGDFGIARQIERTSSGMSKKGTYTYMAPEVFRGYEYGSSVDIYSLGIVMYRYLNRNRTPFLPDFPNEMTPKDRDMAMQRRMDGYPLPDIKGVPAELNAVVLKACAYDRKQRFASPTEMRERLEAISDGKSHAPVSPPVAEPATGAAHGGMEKTERMFFGQTTASIPRTATTSKIGTDVLPPSDAHERREPIEDTFAHTPMPKPYPKKKPNRKSKMTLALVAAYICVAALIFGIIFIVLTNRADDTQVAQFPPVEDELAEAESPVDLPEPDAVQTPAPTPTLEPEPTPAQAYEPESTAEQMPTPEPTPEPELPPTPEPTPEPVPEPSPVAEAPTPTLEPTPSPEPPTPPPPTPAATVSRTIIIHGWDFPEDAEFADVHVWRQDEGADAFHWRFTYGRRVNSFPIEWIVEGTGVSIFSVYSLEDNRFVYRQTIRVVFN